MGTLEISNIKSVGGLPVSVAAIEQAVAQVNQPSAPAIHKQYYLAANFVATGVGNAFHAIRGAISTPLTAPSSALAGFTYDPLTGIHTCTEAGVYLLNANLSISGDANNQSYYTQGMVNGVRVSGLQSTHRQIVAAHTHNIIHRMAVGDTYTFDVYTLGTEVKTVAGTTNFYSSFSHARLSL